MAYDKIFAVDRMRHNEVDARVDMLCAPPKPALLPSRSTTALAEQQQQQYFHSQKTSLQSAEEPQQ